MLIQHGLCRACGLLMAFSYTLSVLGSGIGMCYVDSEWERKESAIFWFKSLSIL